MRKIKKALLLGIITIVVSGLITSRPARGITIKEEDELSRKVLGLVKSQYTIIDDPVIARYISRLGKRILKSLPPQPFTYHFYVIETDVYNAFAIPGGHIFINSGLFGALENEEELAGIVAHEIAHVVCRHISRKIDKSKKLNWATLAGMAAGVLVGMYGGSPAAGQALSTGAMAAGQSVMLSNSREDEIQADQRGLSYLEKTGYDGAGLLSSLKKMRSKQWFGSGQIPTYLMTHPASEDRIAYISSWLDNNPQTRPHAPRRDPYAFKLARNRVIALYSDEDIALKRLKRMAAKNPDDAMAQYGYGLILARIGNRQEAIRQVKRSLEKRAFDPFLLTDLGRIYFLDGRYPDALNALEGAVSIDSQYPVALFYLAKTQMGMGNLTEGAEILEKLVATTPYYNQAFYSLGEAYGKQGKLGEAHYYLGVFFWNRGNAKKAEFHLQRASESVTDRDKISKINKMLEKIQKRSNGKPDKKRG